MSETAYVSDFFQLIDMKVLITEDTLDSLLSIKISSDGGKTYTDYSVSSLKNGITFNCSPNDLKVICDANVLKYIQVLADGEKSTSNVDLSDYLKFKDIYVDVYKNPYFNVILTENEKSKLSDLDNALYNYNYYEYYCSGNEFTPDRWSYSLKLVKSSDSNLNYYDAHSVFIKADSVFIIGGFSLPKNDDFCYLVVDGSDSYFNPKYRFFTNARVHFIKHF